MAGVDQPIVRVGSHRSGCSGEIFKPDIGHFVPVLNSLSPSSPACTQALNRSKHSENDVSIPGTWMMEV